MKIGLLLGSFDPIHVSHIHIASCVLNGGLCDKVLFVVAQHNPFKLNKPAPFDVRCSMVNASIKAFNGKCEVCYMEKYIEPPTYSYKVLREILKKYPNDEFFLICGTDTINLLPKWKNFEQDIKNKFGFIEIIRGDNKDIDDITIPFIITPNKDKKDYTTKEFWCLKTQRMEISSTIIRNMIKKGMNPYPLINKESLDLIKKYNLYAD